MTDPKSKILARRARFLAAAAASAGLVAGGPVGCSDGDETPTVVDGGDDTAPSVCLAPDIGFDDTGPMPCLTPIEDTGVDDTGAEDTNTDASSDTGPMPCLAPPPGDSG